MNSNYFFRNILLVLAFKQFKKTNVVPLFHDGAPIFLRTGDRLGSVCTA